MYKKNIELIKILQGIWNRNVFYPHLSTWDIKLNSEYSVGYSENKGGCNMWHELETNYIYAYQEYRCVQFFNDAWNSYWCFWMNELFSFVKIKTFFLFTFQWSTFFSVHWGLSAKDSHSKAMTKTFTNSLAMVCSWKGFKNNFKMEGLIILHCLYGKKWVK